MDIPGYQLERELGRGGMASVYLAIQTSVERRVALKVMSPVLLVDPSFAERFTREARIAANLYHPHIVAVHDVGLCDDQPYIAMEYLPGGDLAARLAAGRIDTPGAVRVVREIASALDYAHQKGFVHRDVKPENILFREDMSAVLTDFGIARAVNSATQMTRTGAVIGTPQYMSPEQARGRKLDGRSDLYGLGIVFYELLTGDVPFRGDDSVAVGIMHVTEPVPPLPRRLALLQPILDRFLAKHPDDRFQRGAEAVVRLEQVEAQLITGPNPPVTVATPIPRSPDRPRDGPAEGRRRAASSHSPDRRASDPPAAGPEPGSDAPATVSRPAFTPPEATSSGRVRPGEDAVNVAATPRPDGSLRREPTLGALDDLASFDRTVGQPAFSALRVDQDAAPRRVRRRRRPVGGLFLLLLAAIGAAAWWQRDALLALVPDPEVHRLLERARAAYEYRHYYGDSQEYANRLYARVLALDPDNEQARAGLELLAETFLREFDAAVARDDLTAARTALARAEELAPTLAAVAAARGRLERVVVPASDDAGPPAGDGSSGDGTAGSRSPPSSPDPEVSRTGGGSEANAASVGRIDRPPAVDASAPDPVPSREAIAALDALLAEGERLLALDRLTRPADGNALAAFREAADRAPEDPRPVEGVTKVAERLLALAEIALERDALAEAEAQLDQIAALRPQLPGLARARERLELYREQRAPRRLSSADEARLAALLADAERALGAGDLLEPPGASAYDALKAALTIDPTSQAVQAGLSKLAGRLLALARAALADGELATAGNRLAAVQQTDPGHPGLPALRADLATAWRAASREALAADDIAAAQEALLRAVELAPDHADVPELELALTIARDDR